MSDETKEPIHYFDDQIPYPVEVASARTIGSPVFVGDGPETGALVCVKPVDEKYGGKTHLGIYLGQMIAGTMAISYCPELKLLSTILHYNPAIFVPEIREVIWGCESFWKVIDSEEDFEEISNEEIENLWYIKALKKLVADKEGD